MVFTLVGYHESKTCASLLAINALADDHVTVAGDDITVPELNKIAGVCAISANMANAQLSSPSLRRMFLEDLAELTVGAAPEVVGAGYNDYTKSPIELDRSEKLNALVDNGGNAEDNVVLVWLSDGALTPITGRIHTLRTTQAGVTSTFAWVNGALVLTQTLPAGRYAIVGARCFTATASLAFRFVFVGGAWRPGGLTVATIDEAKHPTFRRGRLGYWGEFEFDQPPTVDFLAPVATGAVELYMDLIQIRSGR